MYSNNYSNCTRCPKILVNFHIARHFIKMVKPLWTYWIEQCLSNLTRSTTFTDTTFGKVFRREEGPGTTFRLFVSTESTSWITFFCGMNLNFSFNHMGLILDKNSEHAEKIELFWEKKFEFLTALGLVKWLEQIK